MTKEQIMQTYQVLENLRDVILEDQTDIEIVNHTHYLVQLFEKELESRV